MAVAACAGDGMDAGDGMGAGDGVGTGEGTGEGMGGGMGAGEAAHGEGAPGDRALRGALATAGLPT